MRRRSTTGRPHAVQAGSRDARPAEGRIPALRALQEWLPRSPACRRPRPPGPSSPSATWLSRRRCWRSCRGLSSSASMGAGYERIDLAAKGARPASCECPRRQRSLRLRHGYGAPAGSRAASASRRPVGPRRGVGPRAALELGADPGFRRAASRNSGLGRDRPPHRRPRCILRTRDRVSQSPPAPGRSVSLFRKPLGLGRLSRGRLLADRCHLPCSGRRGAGGPSDLRACWSTSAAAR
jgi:hypothetical protein